MISRIAAAVVASLIFCTCFPVAVDAASGSDVLVVGGTPAGVAAAIAAARRGENVTLVAARPVLGGVLTDATMDQWDLNLAPNTDTEVEGGIFREIYAELGDSFGPGDAARVFGALVASEPRIHTIVNATPASVRVSGPAGARQIDDVTPAASRSRSAPIRSSMRPTTAMSPHLPVRVTTSAAKIPGSTKRCKPSR
jgi:hypothetical protein